MTFTPPPLESEEAGGFTPPALDSAETAAFTPPPVESAEVEPVGTVRGQFNTARKSWKQLQSDRALGYAVQAAERLGPDYELNKRREEARQGYPPLPGEAPAEWQQRIERTAQENYAAFLKSKPHQARAEAGRALDEDQLFEAMSQAALKQSEAAAIGESADVTEYNQREGFWNKLAVVLQNPVELPLNIAIKGGVQSLPSIVQAGAAGAVGGLPLAALGSFTGSLNAEMIGSLNEALAQENVDLKDTDAVKTRLQNPEWLATARQRAAQRGLPVAGFDALSAVVGGHAVSGATRGARVAAAGREMLEQAAMGGGGEFAGQVASGDDFDPTAIMEEMMGEVAGGTRDIAQGALSRDKVASKPSTPQQTQPAVFSEFGSEAEVKEVATAPAAVTTEKGITPPPSGGTPAPAQADLMPSSILHPPSSPAQTTVPELPATLHGQIVKLREGKAPAVLFTPEDTVPDWALKDERFDQVQTKDGTVLYDTAAWTKDQITQLVDAGQTGTVLGYGTPSKPAQPTGAIVVRDKQGLELRAVLVDDATAPAALKAAQAYAGPEDVVKFETPEEVLSKRLEATTPVETEKQRMARESVEAMRALATARKAAEAEPKSEDGSQPALSVTSAPEVPSNNPPIQQSTAKVTERHLAEARAAVADLRGESAERAPDIIDEIEGQVTSGIIRVPEDMADVLDASRERIAGELHQKPWKRLSSAQRKAINKELRLSTTEGTPANKMIGALGEKYADLSADDFANAILDAGESRLLERKKGDSKEVLAMAEEIARAEAQTATDETVMDWDQAAAIGQSEAGIDSSEFRDHIQPVGKQYGATPKQVSTILKEGQAPYEGQPSLQPDPSAAGVDGQSGSRSDSLKTFSTADFARDFSNGNRIVSAIDQSKAPPSVPTYNVNGTVINSPLDFVRTLTALRSPNNESLKVVILDKNNVVVHSEVMSAGTIDSIPVDYRDFARLAEKHKDGSRMLISHNHPSGDPTPSKADIAVTDKLRQAATRAGFDIVDHVITNGGTYYSLDSMELLQLPEYKQADWEVVRRDKLKKIESVDAFTDLVSTLRMMATPDATHIFYGSTRSHVNAIERTYANTFSDLEKLVLRGIGREAASMLWIDYGPNVTAAQAADRTQQINRALKAASSTTQVIDYAAKGLLSSYGASMGLLETQTAPSDTLKEDANKYSKQNERATGQKIERSDEISPDVKRAITEYLYDPRSNRTDRETADGLVQQFGVDAATALWRTPPADFPGAVKSKLLGSITRSLAEAERQARIAGDTAAQQAAVDRQAALWNEALPRITNTAQELQAMNDLVAMSPDAQVARAKRDVESVGDKEVENHRQETNAMRTALDEGRATGIEAVKQDAETNKAAREAVNETIKESAETKTAIIMELAGPWAQSEYIVNHAREAVRAKANELLNRQPRPAGFTPAQHLRQILDDLASRAASIFAGHIQGSEPGVLLVDKLQQRLGIDKAHAVKLATSLSKEWDAQLDKARKALDTRLANARARQEQRAREPESNSAVDRALRKQLRDLNLKLGDAIRQAAADRQRTGEHIADRIVQASGLTGPAADALRVKLKARYDAITAEAQQNALDGISKRSGVKISKKMRDAFDRLVEMDRLAPVDGDAFFKAVRAALKLPELTEAQAKELRQLVLDAQAKPEGWQQQRIMGKVLTLVENAKGTYAWHDTAFAVWYANIFSALPTHVANIVGNTMKAVEVVGIESLRNPLAAGQIIKAFARGVESGALEAGNVMLTGSMEGTRLLKAEAARPLEAKIQKGGWNRIWLPWAAIARAMAAEDVVFFKGHEEVKWQLLARRVAQREGLRGEQLDARVQDLMHGTRAAYEAAKVQAATEGLTSPLDVRRRAHEIIEQKREADMDGSTDQARRFALEHTFNSEPYGVMGSIAEVLNTANRKLVVTRFAIPVVRIMANLANESLNYFPPVGLARVIVPKFRSDITVRAGGDVDALSFYQARALVGTALFGALLAAMFGNDDEEEKFIEITGQGPRTKNQKEQLRATGWKPNALRVGDRWYSYQESQLNIPLAILGNYSDAIKYKGLEQQDALNRTAYVMQTTLNTILDQRMLSGVGDLMDALQPESAGTADLTRVLARSGSSFVVPNAVRWIDQVFDPAVYEADDVKGALYAQTPFVRRQNRAALNALGEPVERHAMDRFTTPVKPDDLMRLIAAKNAWIPMPNLDEQTVGNAKLGDEYQRPMSPDEYYVWIAESGPQIRAKLTENIATLAGMTTEEAQAYVRKVTVEERAKVKPR